MSVKNEKYKNARNKKGKKLKNEQSAWFSSRITTRIIYGSRSMVYIAHGSLLLQCLPDSHRHSLKKKLTTRHGDDIMRNQMVAMDKKPQPACNLNTHVTWAA